MKVVTLQDFPLRFQSLMLPISVWYGSVTLSKQCVLSGHFFVGVQSKVTTSSENHVAQKVRMLLNTWHALHLPFIFKSLGKTLHKEVGASLLLFIVPKKLRIT